MNKAGKMAFSWLKAQSDIEKIRFIAQAIGSIEYQAFIKKNRPDKQHSHNLPSSFLKWYLPQQLVTHYHGENVSLRSVPQKTGDKLEIFHTWMPTGQFAPSRNGSYIPLGTDFVCTALMRPFLLKQQEACLTQAWQEAIPLLRSPDVSNDRVFTDPWLDYEPYLTGDADVYFLLDEPQQRVKIGVSGNLRQRVDTLKRQYDNSTLRFISIIPSGGVETESALHRFFHQYRVDKKRLGREWFSYTDELREFIDTLNTYAIRSHCLKAYGII
ncbi:GIY-YIG nuclease family protein [Pectobacterium sp. CHL-2024]|uniref:GIY-YIG nuclease family protein n=1 Tax=Pectobacterium TaxID=122277 RepID=UPI001CF4A0BE|nr:GIY-YIG nuclease family protein [Pectobacterium polaris]MCA6942813.1 GIY-YIG nuclease family protein [Pectobacterium polaris]MCA6957926.1 GIY-YIG nuclease family protein [Pectobacterium polaris]